jgi:hypothetical protein
MCVEHTSVCDVRPLATSRLLNTARPLRAVRLGARVRQVRTRVLCFQERACLRIKGLPPMSRVAATMPVQRSCFQQPTRDVVDRKQSVERLAGLNNCYSAQCALEFGHAHVRCRVSWNLMHVLIEYACVYVRHTDFEFEIGSLIWSIPHMYFTLSWTSTSTSLKDSCSRWTNRHTETVIRYRGNGCAHCSRT